MIVQQPSSRSTALVEALRRGELAIIAEGRAPDSLIYLVAAGQSIEPAVVNRMAIDGRGIISLALSHKQAERLGLRRLGQANARRWSWGTSPSIEARHGVGTGISALDRARTVAVASASDATPEDIVSPGHIFPILAHPGGLVEWQGVAEATVEAADLAGKSAAAAFCHILTGAGEAARWTDLAELPHLADLPVCTFSDILVSRHMASDSFEQAFAAAFQ
jgi:3,4-dihydroxy 2-butanone 4-phosphate synthase / GTP cyclohydrolase II